MEGAMLAASALKLLGHSPLVMDLKSRRGDDDHIVTLFTVEGCFGAISKTNHAALRYRDPIYTSLRELAMSYMHEYFLKDGTKTLRSYSEPFDLSQFQDLHWETSQKDLWVIPRSIDRSPHISLLSQKQISMLRKADSMERKAGNLTEWNPQGKRFT
jgi:hypothetical protein